MSNNVTIDLEKLSSLTKEIEILEKRKSSIQYELDRIGQECLTKERETEKRVEQELARICVETDYRNGLLSKRQKELDDREVNIAAVEKDLEGIHKEVEDLRISKSKFQKDKSDFEVFKTQSHEKQHEAQLIIEQYQQKLAELK